MRFNEKFPHSQPVLFVFICGLAVVMAAANIAEAAQVGARLVVKEGDTVGSSTVSAISALTANGNGKVGGLGSLADGDRFIWYDTGVIWQNSYAPDDTLSGGESTMGIGDNQEFIYSPSYRGEDAVYTHNGLLAVENTQAAGFPAGTNSTFHSRPTMIPGGAAYWVSGFNESGGTSSEGRMFYSSSDATPGNIAVVLRSDDVIDGFTIDRPSGVGFDYDISDNGAHHIHELLMDTGSTLDDGFVYVNGSLVARETSPTGQGDNWDNFDHMSINNSGNYLFCGDTDGSSSSDEFIAYNGSIVIREGDTIGGFELTSTAYVRGLAIRNDGWAAHVWGRSGGSEEALFVGKSNDLAASSQRVVAAGDSVDTDGDMVPDYVINDFNASSFPAVGFGAADSVFLEFDIEPVGGGTEIEAILGFDVSDIVPVELVSFSAKGLRDGVVLEWSTASELNNLGFEIQHRVGTVFQYVDFVDGYGTTLEPQFYSYQVTDLDHGSHAFRLKQVDFDGTYALSPVVEAVVGLPNAYHLTAIQPNPFHQETQFSISVAKAQRVVIGLYDLSGRRVAELFKGRIESNETNSLTISSEGIPSGTYLLKVSGETFHASQEVMLLK